MSIKRAAPIITLLLLAPIIAELLSASTTLSDIGGLIFFIPMYGAGALLIRELVRRRQRGWASIFTLGLAYGLIEEGLVVGAIFHPQAIAAASWGAHAGGYVFGVYAMFAIAVTVYHALWSITVPILLTDTIFPARARDPYLTKRGLLFAGICYMLGTALVAAIVRGKIASGYSTPTASLILTTCIIAILLIVALWMLPPHNNVVKKLPTRIPSRGLLTIIGLMSGFAVMGLFTLPVQFTLLFTHGLFVLIPVMGAIIIIGALGLLLRNWTRSVHWTRLHTLGITSGIIVANPLIALSQSFSLSLINRIGLIAMELITICLLSFLAIRIKTTR